jgi:hypothetical protein
MKLKLKGRRFDTIEEIQAELQRESKTLQKRRTSRNRSKNGEDGGTGVCMREGTTSRVITAHRSYGEFYDFYSVSPEYFGIFRTLKCIEMHCRVLTCTDIYCLVLTVVQSSLVNSSSYGTFCVNVVTT